MNDIKEMSVAAMCVALIKVNCLWRLLSAPYRDGLLAGNKGAPDYSIPYDGSKNRFSYNQWLKGWQLGARMAKTNDTWILELEKRRKKK